MIGPGEGIFIRLKRKYETIGRRKVPRKKINLKEKENGNKRLSNEINAKRKGK
ncbi:MAG: hypothetical protein ABIJ34_07580 [archaeon]